MEEVVDLTHPVIPHAKYVHIDGIKSLPMEKLKGTSVMVIGRLIEYNLRTHIAVLEHNGSRLTVDISFWDESEVPIHLLSLYLVIGEFRADEGALTTTKCGPTLHMRVIRNVDGLGTELLNELLANPNHFPLSRVNSPSPLRSHVRARVMMDDASRCASDSLVGSGCPGEVSARPVCPGHGLPCALRVVRKAGKNVGRRFYTCCKPISQQCTFFQWASSVPGLVDEGLPTPSSPPSVVCKKRKRVLPSWMLSHESVMKNREAEYSRFHERKAALRSKAIAAIPSTLSSTTTTTVDSLIGDGRVVVFDLETTGLSSDDGICEIGAVELVDGERTGSCFHSYARPLSSVHPLAYEAHHLSDEFLRKQRSIEVVMDSFVSWLGHPAALVAHNMNFDCRLLKQELRRWGMNVGSPPHDSSSCAPRVEDAIIDGRIHVDHLVCTMQMFRKAFPGAPYSLDAARRKLGLAQHLNRFTHGALLDAEITAEVYQYFLANS